MTGMQGGRVRWKVPKTRELQKKQEAFVVKTEMKRKPSPNRPAERATSPGAVSRSGIN